MVCSFSCLLVSHSTCLNIQQNILEGQVETAFVHGGPPVVSLEENNKGTNFLFLSSVI